MPLILEGFVPFDRELSIVAVRARDGDDRVLAGRRERARRRHPPRHPRAGAGARRRARRPRPRRASGPLLDVARLRRRRVRRAVRDRRRAPRQRDGAPRAQQRPLDDRGRRRRASSRTTCARCSAGRSARPTPRGVERDGQLHRRRCPTATAVLAIRARTCTTTARRRGPGARSGTSPSPRPIRPQLDAALARVQALVDASTDG